MPIPEMIPVASSLIESVGYEGEAQRLYVKFHSGAGPTYSYEGVPRELYDDLMNAASVGRFFLKQIKPNFTGEKL